MTEIISDDEKFMREALREAKKGEECGEVPVGAVLVFENKVIARGHNFVESGRDASMHAEMVCLKEGTQYFSNWRLLKTTLYCTLEPCAMCAGALLNHRVQRVVWGAPDVRMGAGGSWIDLFAQKHPMHIIGVTPGVLAEESANLLKAFFRARRECLVNNHGF